MYNITMSYLLIVLSSWCYFVVVQSNYVAGSWVHHSLWQRQVSRVDWLMSAAPLLARRGFVAVKFFDGHHSLPYLKHSNFRQKERGYEDKTVDYFISCYVIY